MWWGWSGGRRLWIWGNPLIFFFKYEKTLLRAIYFLWRILTFRSSHWQCVDPNNSNLVTHRRCPNCGIQVISLDFIVILRKRKGKKKHTLENLVHSLFWSNPTNKGLQRVPHGYRNILSMDLSFHFARRFTHHQVTNPLNLLCVVQGNR